MPRLAPRPCNSVGCKEMASQEGHCLFHLKRRKQTKHRDFDRKRLSASRRGYNTAHYKLRKLKIARNPICEYENCNKPSLDLHHLDGDPWNRSWENLQMLCHEHHSSITAREQRGKNADAM